jgi:hypothetical protein
MVQPILQFQMQKSHPLTINNTKKREPREPSQHRQCNQAIGLIVGTIVDG